MSDLNPGLFEFLLTYSSLHYAYDIISVFPAKQKQASNNHDQVSIQCTSQLKTIKEIDMSLVIVVHVSKERLTMGNVSKPVKEHDKITARIEIPSLLISFSTYIIKMKTMKEIRFRRWYTHVHLSFVFIVYHSNLLYT